MLVEVLLLIGCPFGCRKGTQSSAPWPVDKFLRVVTPSNRLFFKLIALQEINLNGSHLGHYLHGHMVHSCEDQWITKIFLQVVEALTNLIFQTCITES